MAKKSVSEDEYRAAKQRQADADGKYKAALEGAGRQYEQDLPPSDVELIRAYEAAEDERMRVEAEAVKGT